MSVSVKAQDVSDLNETQKNLYNTLLASQAEQTDQIHEASADEADAQTREADDTTLDAAKQSTEDQNVVTSDGTAVENNNSDTKSSTVTYLFDVTLKHGDEAVEPKGEVQVSIQSDLFKSTDSDLSIIHLDEVKNKAVDTEAVINTDEGTAVLSTDSFSVYVIKDQNSYSSLSDAFNNAENGSTIKLDSDFNNLEDVNILIKENKSLTLDLNGHSLYFNEVNNNNAPIYIENGSTLTIKDSFAEGENPTYKDTISSDTVSNNYNNIATNSLDNSKKIDTVTYYVTESDALGTTTTETTKKHVYSTKGYIVGDIKTGRSTGIVYVSSGATFNLQSGLLTAHTDYKDGYADGHSVFNCGTFNMTGGYIVGRNSNQKGAGICATSGSTTNLSGGVIAANSTSDGGGAVYLDRGNLNISNNAIISGNNSSGSGSTEVSNGGGGIYAINSKIVINGGYITNNSYTGAENTDNATRYGGGAIWTNDGSEITINDGQVTGNYSNNGGGGLYIGSWNSKATLYLHGGIVASNYCKTGEGGGIRVAGADNPNSGSLVEINGDKKTYITNNINKTDNSWGGGGIFVQQNGHLKLTNVLITLNTADGYGGGFASCPTGNTNINMSYAGIYSNTAAGTNFSKKSLSEKNDDEKAKINDSVTGQQAADYFVGAYSHVNEKVATLTNSMLGGGTSYWTGQAYDINLSEKFEGTLGRKENTKDYTNKDTLEISKMAALHAEPNYDDKTKAIAAARVFITGNTSNTNGGGIMTNGYVTVGQVLSSNKYPVININGTKVLQLNNKNQNIREGEFGFELLKNKPSYSNGNLEISTNSVIATTANSASEGPSNSSSFSFNNVALNDCIPSGQSSGTITLYLVETKGNEESITYSQDFYEITIPFDTKTITEGDGSSKTEITVYKLVGDSSKQLTIKKYTDANNSTQVYPTDNFNNVYSIDLGNSENDYKYTGTINLTDLGNTFVNNIPAYLLTIYKYQAGAETNGPLEGVQFKLYGAYDSGNGQVSDQLLADSAGTLFGTYGTLTTTADGVVKIGYLKYGDYYLKETKAKDGFEKLDKVIKITVNSTGISATYADGTELSNIVKEDTHMPSGEAATSKNHYCLHIANNSGTVLPSTGGIGTDWFILGGCGLISIALIYALLMHSNREGGDLG